MLLARASDYPLAGAFLTMLWFFLWVLWFMLLFKILFDIFRDDSLSGWAKAGWVIFVCILPFLGVFVYLIARGRGMGARDVRQAQQQDAAFRAYVQEAAAGTPAAGASSGADQLVKLAGLRDHGDLTEEEFQQAKARLLATG